MTYFFEVESRYRERLSNFYPLHNWLKPFNILSEILHFIENAGILISLLKYN